MLLFCKSMSIPSLVGRRNRSGVVRWKRVLALVVGGTAGALALGLAACGSFDAEESPLPLSEAAPPIPQDGAVADSAADTGDGDGDGSAPELCTIPRAPACAFVSCASRALYEPSVPSFPFGIDTDATHVFWVDQPEVDGGNAYNGDEKSRVLRAAKAKGAGGAEILATQQGQSTAIAVDDASVYWVAQVATGGFELRRIAKGCSVPCVPVVVAQAPGRLQAFRRTASGVFFALSGDRAYRLDVRSNNPVFVDLEIPLGVLPALTTIDEHAYFAADGYGFVARAGVDSGVVEPEYIPIGLVDGGLSGFGAMTNDCSSLWVDRRRPAGVNLHRLALDGTLTFRARLDGMVFGMTADARFVYIAQPNAGGVYAVETAGSTPPIAVARGNVWAVATDADGVYWGEHQRGTGGRLHMLVK